MTGLGDDRPDTRRNDRPGRNPADVAVALHDRAVLLYGDGELDRASRACRHALRLMERAVGRDGPDVAAILNSLAAIAQDRADYAEGRGPAAADRLASSM